ncbi:MAG: hypothetical protein JSW06_03630 [Thermoplasmatales archaeon]|nr:MAG: hypothetical protein JSW06_03630 [Thermoplasmatales archaeon]
MRIRHDGIVSGIVLMLMIALFPAMQINVIATGLPPVADAGGPYTGFEGSNITFDASGSYDPEGDDIFYNWDLDGDGFLDFRTWSDDPTITYMWLDDYYGNVTVNVTDFVDYVDDTTTVTVLNVAPNITSLTGLPSDPISISTTVGLTSTFTDPGILDTHTATIDWGDGTTSSGIVTETNGSGTATGTHIYTEAGVYTVTLNITDKDGGSDIEVYQYVVVYDPSDPSSGFVTGGGWIDSPAGAYRADPTLTGTANFGFVSKYKKGQSNPTGNTEFQYQVASLNFHSKNYDWLIVAGAKAIYKGTGTINGDGNYGFMIFVIDEKLTSSSDVDMFRIKIWDQDDNDSIVYDNNLEENGTELSGGQIVIHKK